MIDINIKESLNDIVGKDVFSNSVVGKVRQANEDNCGSAITPNGYLFVVCDGMGGHVGGATASKIAVQSIMEYFSKGVYDNVYQALSAALNFANMKIIGKTLESQELKGMGTTACILLIQENEAWIAHVGDSRIYLYCQQQQWLHRITKDHSFVQGLVDQGLISDAEAEHHPNKNRILKALGVKESLEPEVCIAPVLPAKNDIFLICSDGLSGMLSDEKLQYVLQQKSSIQQKGQMMIDLANQEGGTDNITVQLICTSKSPYKTSTFVSKNPKDSQPLIPNQIIPKTKTNHLTKKIWILISVLFIAIIMGLFVYKFLDKSKGIGKQEQKQITMSSLTKESLFNLIDSDNINSQEYKNIKDSLRKEGIIIETGVITIEYKNNYSLSNKNLETDLQKVMEEVVSDFTDSTQKIELNTIECSVKEYCESIKYIEKVSDNKYKFTK